MSFNEQLPEWQNEGTKPPQSKIVEGWNPTEKPPASWFNWLFGRAYKVMQELQDKAATKQSVEDLDEAFNEHLDEKATDPIRPHGMGTIAKEDYEEGEFTPALQFGGGSAGMSYTSRSGRFTKVGRKIHVQGTINLSAKGSSTGNASITGLPFSSASSGPIVSAPLYALRVNPDIETVGGVWATLNAGVSEVLIAIAGSAGGLSLNDTHFVDNSILRFEFTYTI